MPCLQMMAFGDTVTYIILKIDLTLTRLVFPECFVGLVPQRLAVLLQFEEAVPLPGARADLDQFPADQEEI